MQIRMHKADELWYYIWGEGQGQGGINRPPVRIAQHASSRDINI
jgi:hypothetical protein